MKHDHAIIIAGKILSCRAVQLMRQRPLCVCAAFLYLFVSIQALAGHSFLPASPSEECSSLRSMLLADKKCQTTVWGIIRRNEWTGQGHKLFLDRLHFQPEEGFPADAGYGSGKDSGSISGRTASDTPASFSENPRIILCAFVPEGDPAASVQKGQTVCLCGSVHVSSAPTNPGQFDMRNHDQASGIFYRMNGPKLLSVIGKPSPWAAVDRVRTKLSILIGRTAVGNDAGMMRAILLGDRSGLDSRIRNSFSQGGISHILAVSGLHIGIFGMGLYQLLRRHRLPLRFCCLFSAFFVWLYCDMTGMGVSTQRAMIMYLVWIGSCLTGRTSDPFSSLAAAAAAVLILHPANVREAGFYLSFGCILSILLVVPPIQKHADTLKKCLPRLSGTFLFRKLTGPITFSLGIFLGTLPLSCAFFFQFSPWSVPANLLIIPLMPFVMLAGIAAAIGGSVAAGAGRFLFSPAHYLLRLFLQICSGMDLLPASQIITGKIAWWKIPVYYLLLTAALHTGKKHPFRSFLFLPAALMLLLFSAKPSFRITFLDAGQGDCILIQSGKTAFLTDCGSSTVTDLWDYRTESTLKYYGINTLEGIFLTHGDSDHINGVRALIEEGHLVPGGYFRSGGICIRQILTAQNAPRYDLPLREILDEAEKAGIRTSEIKPGSILKKGDLSITAIWPGELEKTDWEELAGNAASLVLLVQYQGFKVLLTGDLEKDGEEKMLSLWTRRYRDSIGPIHILKAGHHGSRHATSSRLLEILSPSLAVISCGKDNFYGHPSQEVLERLDIAGCRVWRTDQDGALTVENGCITGLLPEP